MNRTVGDLIKSKYPQSTSIVGFPLFGVALLAINLLKLSNVLVADFVLKLFTYTGLLLIGIFILIIIVETLAKIIPLMKGLLQVLVLIPLTISRLYVFLVKKLIKSAVVEIIGEKENYAMESFTLRNRGQDRSDDFWSRIINFDQIEELKLVVQPTIKTDYWRLGFKFSQNEQFTSARFAQNFPLFHLTKDRGENKLKFDYYKEEGIREKVLDSELIRNYKNEKVYLEIKTMRGVRNLIRIRILDVHKKQVLQKDFILLTHKFAQLFAWGDGYEYELKIENFIQQ